MGYYTAYSLQVRVPGDPTPEEVMLGLTDDLTIINALRDEYEEAEFAFDEDGGCNNHTKWYEHDGDLREFSERFPRCLFVLSCQGEEGEQWIEYFKDGKYCMIEPIITWPEFDESLLK